MRIMQYGASRPDADASSAGSASSVACAKLNVLPWTNVTWTEARNACCGLNTGGACPGAGAVGWRLCNAQDWQSACEGPSRTCDWSYALVCSSSQRTTCNGKELDCNGSAAGDQDCLYPTGSAYFSDCYTDWASAGGVYDLSGNVQERTATEASSGFYQVRGGSYSTIEAGRACAFDFAVGATGSAHPSTGFRCCYY